MQITKFLPSPKKTNSGKISLKNVTNTKLQCQMLSPVLQDDG